MGSATSDRHGRCHRTVRFYCQAFKLLLQDIIGFIDAKVLTSAPQAPRSSLQRQRNRQILAGAD